MDNSGVPMGLDGDHLGLSGSRWDVRSALGTTLGLDSIGKEVGHSWDMGRDLGSLQLATAEDPFASGGWGSGGGGVGTGSGGDEQQAELFHVQWQLIREQISVLSRELIQARSEIRSLRTGLADLHTELDNETSHRQELTARLEASVKAVADEADAACRGLQAEVADRIAAQERTLRDISASEDRQSKNVLEVRHQCDAINDQVDALRLETQMDSDRLRGQIMELHGALENEKRERISGDDNLHRDVAKLKELLDTETNVRSTTGMEVDRMLKSLSMDIDAVAREHVAAEQAMKQAHQEFDDKLEQETKARIAGDTRNEKSLEAAGDSLKAELQDESVRTKNAIRLLTENYNHICADLENEIGLRLKQEDILTKETHANKASLEKMHKDLHENLEQEIRDRSSVCEALSRTLTQEERERVAGDTELHADLDSAKHVLEENIKKVLAVNSDIKGSLDSETKERQASVDKLGADLRSLSKLLGDQVLKETEERCASHAEAMKLANAAKTFGEQEGAERRAGQDEMRKRLKQLAEQVETEKSNRDLHGAKLDNQLNIHAKNYEREKEARIRDHEGLKGHIIGMQDRLADEIREVQSMNENNLRKATESVHRNHEDLRSALEAHVSATALNVRETDSAIKTLRQHLDQEVKVRATQNAQALAATQDAHEKMQADTAKLQKIAGDHSERLKGMMEGLAAEGKNRCDAVENLNKNVVVLSEGLEREKVERENGDNNIKLRLDTTRQELAEEKEERASDNATLKRHLQNLEGQVSSHLDELKTSHELEVNKNSAAFERVEQAHRELKNGLEEHGVLREETTQEVNRAILSLKKMLDQEAKAREADSLKTTTAFGTVTDQLTSEAAKSAKVTSDLFDKLKKFSDELTVEIQNRIAGDDTNSKQLHGLDSALQLEKAERESGDAALRAQIQTCGKDLEKEKESRLNDTAETRRVLQGLEGTLSQSIEDLRLNIEVETGKRTASDDRIEKKIQELKLLVDTHEQSRTQVEAELDKGLKTVRAALDAEVRSREDAMAEKSNQLARMENRLDGSIKEHTQIFGELHDRLKRLHEELQAEARERCNADEEISEIAMIARNFIEKESKERQKNEEEYHKKHNDLSTSNNQQHATRDLHLAGLEGGLKDQAKLHQSEKEDRLRESAEVRRNMQALVEKFNAMATELRMEQQQEKKQVAEAVDALNRGLGELKGSHNQHAHSTAKKQEDHKEHLISLRDQFELESKARNKERTMITTTLNQLQGKLESDNNERATSMSGLTEQIRLLSEALNVESQERSAGLQREIAMRDQALTMMKQQIEGVKTSISIEKDERTAEVATLGKKTATADSQLAQKLEEVRVNLEGEAGLRAAGDERMERRIGELRTNFDAHVTMNTNSMQELDQKIRSTGQSLEAEVRTRIEESSKHVSANNQLREMLTALENLQAKGHASLQDKIKGIGESLLEHDKIRAVAADEMSKKIKDIIALTETERHDREQGVANVKHQLEGIKQLVAGEKEDRINELSTFRRSLHVEDGKVKQALEDLKHSLELESNKRQSADDRLEKRCNEHKAGLEEASKARVEMSEEFGRTQKILRQALDQEVRVRVEENAKVGSALNRLQDVLDGEVAERQQSNADCIDRIRIVSENLNIEAKERAAGDDECAKLVIAVRQALEKEVKERKASELDMDQKIQEHAAASDHEKGDRERENSAVRAQIAGLRQDLGSERDERAADIAACKRNLSALEGYTTQQMKDIRQILDSETSERIMAHERTETVCNDIRGIIEANRLAHDITAKDLDKAIKQNRQATETESKERNSLFEENHQNLTEIRQMLSNFRGEAMSEKEERIEDVSALRMLLQNIDQKVMVQLRECKLGLENEMSERITNTERLEKRLAELRGAVLVAVRGPGAR